MKIEIYGPGCQRCQNTAEVVKKALSETGVQAEIEKISDLDRILDKGILKTPAVFIDGKKMIEGKVPTVEEVKGWLSK